MSRFRETPRQVWQLLRRNLIAPPVTQAPIEPTYVAGLFSTASGIGESARLCANALEAGGVDVVRLDLSDALDQRDLGELGAAALRSLPCMGTLILHLNAPETETALIKLKLYRPRRWRIVGYWAWELETLPTDWAYGSRYLTEVWTPSRFSAEAIRRQTDKAVKIVPHAIRVPETLQSRGASRRSLNGHLRVLVMGDGRSSLKRKNVSGAIKAFQRAFDDRGDVQLVIKLRNMHEDDSSYELRRAAECDPRINIVNGSINDDERWQLISGCDVFMSLHRSEGFGLTMAEAMACGVPVLATGYSGNLDFMDEESACLVPVEKAKVGADAGPYSSLSGATWASPDIEIASQKLRFLADRPDVRQRIGLRGRDRIRAYASGESYLNALKS